MRKRNDWDLTLDAKVIILKCGFCEKVSGDWTGEISR